MPLEDLLDDLRDTGFLFLPADTTDPYAERHGVRVFYPGWVDRIRVRGPDDVLAVRHDPAGTLAWHHAGPLRDVIAALLALPDPPVPALCPCGHRWCGRT